MNDLQRKGLQKFVGRKVVVYCNKNNEHGRDIHRALIKGGYLARAPRKNPHGIRYVLTPKGLAEVEAMEAEGC